MSEQSQRWRGRRTRSGGRVPSPRGRRGMRRPACDGVVIPAPRRHPTPADPPPGAADPVNYRSRPGLAGLSLDPLTPAERARAWALLGVLALYAVACFLPPLAGADLPVCPALRQLVYGRGGGWCWAGNLGLLAACL